MDGDLESASGLIAAGASGMSDARTGSCLHWTLRAQSATAELVELLLENGCSRTEIDVTGQTALHLAARDYYIPIEVVRLLISSKALRVTDVNKETPLFAAVRTGNLNVVTLLLDSGADASALNRDRRSPLHFAMSYSVAKALLQAGTSPQIRDRTGATALVAALIRDAAGVTRAILERDLTTAEIHSKLLPTCLAAFVGVKQVQVFLDSGADFTKLDSMKRCPLHFATSAAAVKCILAGKSKARRLINARDVEGKTPLARAASEGLDDVCVELITSGADVALVTYCADERCARLIRYPHLYTELGMLLSEIGPDFEGASRALFENGIRTISDAAKLSKADLQSIGISHLQSRLQIYEGIQEMASGCSFIDGRRAFPVFFSYYQSEGTEVARILKLYLQQSLGQAPFLDVDNLMDLQQLLMHVHSSEAVVPLLSKNYFSRPFCLCELCEAVKLGVPLVPVRIVTARKGEAFIFSDYAELIESGPALSSSDWTTVESYGFEKRDVVAAIERISQIHTLDFDAGWDEGTQKSTIERIMQRISNPYTVFTPENRADQGHADFLPEDCADQGVVRSVSRKSRKSSQCCIS
ncbi:Ankyrin repeat domain-containing protein 50 [Hondaea fermentalgiana]|uniref:Ankyrin repeat domain-containing protein 50 n=1 Tax=Hondaea fermentalgiana TaxID=2315210 RepID=A0A2R5GJB4_9STRA|nr:Ankyrin repeat domain-containing protein 50 [Hondaea fermentalgiana]|eukprot:GBG30409.1 Ankyrin repeat domain-containing protein 50 [Hondaea fermentalgiana]